MKIITRQTKANDVSARWARQYPAGKRCPLDAQRTQKKLDALGKVKDPDKVDTIIGNTTWTEITTCSECLKTPQDYVIELGEPNAPDSQTVWLCGNCIEEAWNLAQEGSEPLSRFTQIESLLRNIKKQTASMEPRTEDARNALQAVHTFETELEKLLKEHEWAFIELT